MSNLHWKEHKLPEQLRQPIPLQKLRLLEQKIFGIKHVMDTAENYETSRGELTRVAFWKLFDIYVATTDEKKADTWLLENVVLPRVKERRSVLDVRAKEGDVVRAIMKNFGHAIIFEEFSENAAKLAGKLREDFFGRNMQTSFSLFEGDIRQMAKPNKNNLIVEGRMNYSGPGEPPWGKATYSFEPVDLAMLNQMLFFYPPSEWMGLVDIAYRSVKPGGKVAIIFHGDLGSVADMVRHFGGTPTDVDGLARKIIVEYGEKNVGLHCVETRHQAADRGEMIAEFFMGDSNAKIDFGNPDDVRRVDEYNEAHFRQEDGSLLFTKMDKLIEISVI